MAPRVLRREPLLLPRPPARESGLALVAGIPWDATSLLESLRQAASSRGIPVPPISVVASLAVVVFLLWVYISAVILLYGAEVTASYARVRRALARSERDTRLEA